VFPQITRYISRMEKATCSDPPFPSRWRTLLTVHFSVVAFAVTMQMVPPILPGLVSDSGLTHAQAGTLMGLFTLPGIFLALPGGRLSDALGPRRIGVLSLTLMCIGTALMIFISVPFLYAGRFLAGVGAGIFIVIAPQVITRSFPARELGLAMGFFNTAVPMGSIVSFNGLGYLTERFNIPAVIIATSLLTMASLVSFTLFVRDRDMISGMKHPDRPPAGAGLGPGIWLIATVWTLFNIGLLAYFTYSIDHLSSSGISFGTARFLGSLPMLLSILFTPLAGLLMHRFGFRWSMPAVGCAVSSLAVWMLYFASRGHPWLWSLILGMGLSLVPPAVFTIAGEAVPVNRLGTGYGLLTTLFNIGFFLGIPLVGKVRDLTGGYMGSFGLMAGFLLAGAVISLLSRKRLLEGQGILRPDTGRC
jgi:MFS family permease